MVAAYISVVAQTGEIHDSTAGKPFPNPRFQEAFGSETMSQAADNRRSSA